VSVGLHFETFPSKKWKAVIKKLKWDKTEVPRLSGWRFHDLRHTCASWLVMADVPIVKVAKILGHKALVTTQRYSHLADSSLIDAMDRIQYSEHSSRETDVKWEDETEVASEGIGGEPA